MESLLFYLSKSGQVSENKHWGSRKPPSSAPARVARFRQIYSLKRNFITPQQW